jgi:hypothetical protein
MSIRGQRFSLLCKPCENHRTSFDVPERGLLDADATSDQDPEDRAVGDGVDAARTLQGRVLRLPTAGCMAPTRQIRTESSSILRRTV